MSEIDARDGSQRTALHRACEEADMDKVKFLLKKKAAVNAKDKNNWTPLHCAASSKSLEIVRLLLKAGADPAMITNTETTALHYLCRLPIEPGKKKDGLLAVLKSLLEKGARVNAKNSTGMTCLHEAAYKGSEATITFLIKNGAAIEEKDKSVSSFSSFSRSHLDIFIFQSKIWGDSIALCHACSKERECRGSTSIWCQTRCCR
jgi:ankyrin repeat protein